MSGRRAGARAPQPARDMLDSPHALPRRVVVDAVGDSLRGWLAESKFVERPFLPGGEHNLYELAFAAAELGCEVELRGWLDRSAFERLAAATAARPLVGLPPRRPEADDLVVVPEGWRDPLDYAGLILSPARLALFLLAAPGLFGWPFVSGPWEVPDPLTVRVGDLARPEHFRGMAALGFRLLTPSGGLASAARNAGVDCTLVGTGDPAWAPPPVAEKSTDAAVVLDNRWAPLAERVLDVLGGLSIDRIETVSNAEMVLRLSRARILVWPSRVEGHAKITWEARGVGCVPVALSSNRFAVGLDEEHGAVLVDEVDDLAPAIRALLADRLRWEAMSRLGRETASAEADWDRYRERVRGFLEHLAPPDPARSARAGIGLALDAWLEQANARQAESEEELAVAAQDLSDAMKNQERMLAEISHWQTLYERLSAEHEPLRAARDRLAGENHEFRVEMDALRTEKERVTKELRGLLARRSVRAALRVAETVRTKQR